MKKALTLLLSLAMLFSLAACGQSGGDSTDDAPSTLVYGSADYTRIDPAMDEHCEINLLLFNGLTAHDGNDQIVPALAERWDYDEANCTYTFYLREGVKWHDGEPFTAQDVKFTIEAIMDPDNGSENAPNYEDVQEITVLDDHTVSFRLAEPNAAFLEYMTMAILPQHLLEGEDMQESAFFRAPVGTGPYKLESWDAGQSIVLVRNEDYFLGAPNIERVIFKIVPDDNAQAMQLESGEIDLALLDPKNAQNFAGKDGYTCYDMTTADYRGILFNFNNPYWTENRDIIPAVCYAIDRQAICDKVLNGLGTPAVEFTSPKTPGYSDSLKGNENLKYNKKKAKELWEKANAISPWTSDDKLTFSYNADGGAKPIFEAVVNSVKNTLDIDVTTNPVPTFQEFRNDVTGRKMTGAFRTGWQPDYPSPENYLYQLYSSDAADGNGSNDGDYKNSEFDDLCSKAAAAQTTDEANKLYQQAQEVLLNDLPAVPLYYANAYGVAATGVSGFEMNWQNLPVYENMTKSGK